MFLAIISRSNIPGRFKPNASRKSWLLIKASSWRKLMSRRMRCWTEGVGVRVTPWATAFAVQFREACQSGAEQHEQTCHGLGPASAFQTASASVRSQSWADSCLYQEDSPRQARQPSACSSVDHRYPLRLRLGSHGSPLGCSHTRRQYRKCHQRLWRARRCSTPTPKGLAVRCRRLCRSKSVEAQRTPPSSPTTP